MNCPTTQRMRKLILTGTYAQYRDWLVLHNASQRAAVYIHRAEQFLGLDPDDCEIVLGDGFCDNPAYMSYEYVYFVNEQAKALRLAS